MHQPPRVTQPTPRAKPMAKGLGGLGEGGAQKETDHSAFAALVPKGKLKCDLRTNERLQKKKKRRVENEMVSSSKQQPASKKAGILKQHTTVVVVP